MTCCKKTERLLHALMDGELDAMNAVEFETHLTKCELCAAEYERQTKIRSVIREFGSMEKPSDRLHLDIEAMIDNAAPTPAAPVQVRRSIQSSWWAEGLGLAMAASLALFILLPTGGDSVRVPTGGDSVRDQVVSSHVRSLLASHLTDVETSERHTVRPWFNGKVEAAPLAVDLADEGFPLAGGRLDYIENQVVAALVYKRGNHIINLFVSSAPDKQDIAPRESSFRGYNLCRWRNDGVEFWAVTDAGETELQAFQAAYAGATGAT